VPGRTVTARRHVLRFTVEAAHWDTVERYAANKIRTYTRENKYGADPPTDDEVLREAVFTATPIDKSATKWRVEVEVTV